MNKPPKGTKTLNELLSYTPLKITEEINRRFADQETFSEDIKSDMNKLAKAWENAGPSEEKKLIKKYKLMPVFSKLRGGLKLGPANDLKENPKLIIAGLDAEGDLLFATGNPAKVFSADKFVSEEVAVEGTDEVEEDTDISALRLFAHVAVYVEGIDVDTFAEFLEDFEGDADDVPDVVASYNEFADSPSRQTPQSMARYKGVSDRYVVVELDGTIKQTFQKSRNGLKSAYEYANTLDTWRIECVARDGSVEHVDSRGTVQGFTEGVGLKFSSKKDFEKQAKVMGLKVQAPTVDPDGETNKDSHFLVVKDRQGNNRGEWIKNAGYLTEAVDLTKAVDVKALQSQLSEKQASKSYGVSSFKVTPLEIKR